MASPPSYIQTLDDRSHFKPTVSLYDWWLVKSEDNDGKSKLAVAGVSSAPQEIPRRVFNSAPISKKHDVFTLETTDGVTVILDGIINKQQTIANGFSDEIAKRFQLGFYPGWEKGVAEFLAGDCNTTVVSGRISDSGSEGEGKKDSSPTSVHFSQEETRTPYEHVGSTCFQWNGTSKNLEGNQRNPMSGCSMKHRSSKLLPLSDAFENVGEASGAAVQSGGKLDFDFVEDDMQQTSNAEEGQDFGNVKAQVREGKSGAKGEIKSRKRNMRQVTVDTQEIHSIPEVNKKNNRTPSTLEVKKKKDGTPKANTKKRQVSASLEGSKMRTSTPSTLEVNNKEKVSLSTTKVYTRKRKVSPSTSDVSKKNKSSPLTLEMNNKKEATLSSPKVTAYTSLISPESLSAGRSRSGRLRLRPLEFWRNQSAVYDKDHGVIGIQEEIPRVTPSRVLLSRGKEKAIEVDFLAKL
ncbi:hypothetical protein ACLB2K_056651 [Fragaria x ananassa]